MNIITGPEWNRCNFPALLTSKGYTSGVEVGVQEGLFSKEILAGWPGKLYMVDCWAKQPDNVYHDVANVSWDEHTDKMVKARRAVNRFWTRASLIQEFSVTASGFFQDESQDWIYLDANHSHDATVEDLKAWYPKIKSGGLISGHDYMEGESHNCTFGVISAIEEFLPTDATIYVATEMWSSWYYFKP